MPHEAIAGAARDALWPDLRSGKGVSADIARFTRFRPVRAAVVQAVRLAKSRAAAFAVLVCQSAWLPAFATIRRGILAPRCPTTSRWGSGRLAVSGR